MSREISIMLAVGSAPYQKTLAQTLASGGMLRRLVTFGPNLEIEDCVRDGAMRSLHRYPVNRWFNRGVWGVWRRLPEAIRGGPPVMFSVLLSDWLMSRWIVPATIFHTCAGLSLKSLQVAKRQRAITLLEAAARHPRHWRASAIEECRRFGANTTDAGATFPDALIRRMEREFEICDRIVVNSTVALRSFTQFGYGDKTLLVPSAVDTDLYFPSSTQNLLPGDGRRTKVRVCYVGRVELAKGVGYLLQAWKRLALADAELVLVGEVKPDIRALLDSCSGLQIRSTGFLSPGDVACQYRASDLFVFPSANEGLAQVLLEAMASGLAVVASDRSGALECVTHKRDGLIVPSQDVDALADAILWCHQHRDEVQEMGRAARAKIESRFTLQRYNQSIISLYGLLASRTRQSAPEVRG
jgi:glycosyltransferase involved in cell wall biosynthesis